MGGYAPGTRSVNWPVTSQPIHQNHNNLWDSGGHYNNEANTPQSNAIASNAVTTTEKVSSQARGLHSMVVKLLVVLICTLPLPLTSTRVCEHFSSIATQWSSSLVIANVVNVIWELTVININDEFHSGHLVDSTALITSMGVLTLGTC